MSPGKLGWDTVELLWAFASWCVLTAVVAFAALMLVHRRREMRSGRTRALLAQVERRAVLAWPGSDRAARSLVLELADRVGHEQLREILPWWGRVHRKAEANLSSKRWIVRAQGLRTLEVLGATSGQILHALNDTHPGVRVAAASAGARCPSALVSDALASALGDEDGAVRAAALDSLSRTRVSTSSAVGDALSLALSPMRDQAQYEAPVEPEPAAELAETFEPGAAETPAERAIEPERSTAVALTREVAPGRRVVLLPDANENTPGRMSTRPRTLRIRTPLPAEVRTVVLLLSAAGLCGSSDNPRLLELVIECGREQRAEIRQEALNTLAVLLGQRGTHGERNDSLVELIEKRCLDPDGAVRASALLASHGLGALAVAGAHAALEDRDHAVRRTGARVLARSGALGRLALENALTNPDPYAAAAARAALRGLG